jgi:PKD domain-containing protein/Big-like domain-containing protein
MGGPWKFRRFVVAAVAVALPLTTVMPVHATDAMDQYQDIATGANTLKSPMAQTFTPSASGAIDKLNLKLLTSYGALSVKVQIQSTVNGRPITPPASVLGTSTFTGNATLPWTEFDFNPVVAVQAHTMYAIVVYPTGNLTWYDSYWYDNPTVTGQMWLASGSSWLYQTSFGKDFCFEEFAITGGSTNQPPVLTESSQSVTAPEGSTATMTGTYQDPDGDNVALSASPGGSLTKTGTSSGTWTWSQAGADESPAQQVTITATDGRGGATPIMFNVSFTPMTPTVTIVGAPSTGPEGTGITLTAKATSPSAADQAVGFAYSWTKTKNGGAPSAPVTGSTFTFAPDDEGTFAVTLTAVDDGGNGASVTATITGLNVAPNAVISSVTHSGIVLLPLTPITIGGGFTDPGALDTHTATFDYGDGSPADTTTYGASGSGDTTDTYAFKAPGTYTVTYTVTDDDGGSSFATVKVTVQTPAAALGVIANYVGTMSSLNQGEKNGLIAKYRAAAASAARGDTNATCGQLDAVLNDLSALTSTGQLSQADSDTLASATWAVHRALGCTKVKVAWLNLSL